MPFLFTKDKPMLDTTGLTSTTNLGKSGSNIMISLSLSLPGRNLKEILMGVWEMSVHIAWCISMTSYPTSMQVKMSEQNPELGGNVVPGRRTVSPLCWKHLNYNLLFCKMFLKLKNCKRIKRENRFTFLYFCLWQSSPLPSRSTLWCLCHQDMFCVYVDFRVYFPSPFFLSRRYFSVHSCPLFTNWEFSKLTFS